MKKRITELQIDLKKKIQNKTQNQRNEKSDRLKGNIEMTPNKKLQRREGMEQKQYLSSQ